ncbi:MAG: DUF4926 domain-containing protein [Bacteroidota bacterium]
MEAIQEHDVVVLTITLADQGLEPGDLGTVVHCYGSGEGLEVEFTSGLGETVAVVTLNRSDVRVMRQGEILHVRERVV